MLFEHLLQPFDLRDGLVVGLGLYVYIYVYIRVYVVVRVLIMYKVVYVRMVSIYDGTYTHNIYR